MSRTSFPAPLAGNREFAVRDRLHALFGTGIERAVLAATAAVLLAQLALVFVRQINWDEFYFLSRIHEYRRGELSDMLQTFHVHLFGWLTYLPLDEIGQIVVARLVMLALELGTLAMIFRLARRFASQQSALFAVAAYALCSNVIVHGASFRFDPIATCLLMSALVLLATGRLDNLRAICAGILIAAAGMVTIKAVFYVPAVIGISLLRLADSPDRGRTFRTLVLGGAAALTAFLLFHVAHKLSLRAPTLSQSEAFLSHSVSTMLGFGMVFHNWPYIANSAMGNPVLWLGIPAGVAICVGRLAKQPWQPSMWAVLGLAFPLATVVVYRNAFPYFYVFALAPAAVLFAVAIDALEWPPGRVLLVAVATGVIGALHVAQAFSTTQQAQRTVVRAVHRIFPRPVAYIDRCSMIGSFPKVGFFMSSWLVEGYRTTGRPSFARILRSDHPVFVLANSPILKAALEGRPTSLFPRDAAALRRNFVAHWGPVWVAGKHFAAVGAKPRAFEIAIPGNYTVESSLGVFIDDTRARPGTVVHLALGAHRIRTAHGDQPVTLRWGNHLRVPDVPPPTEDIFNGF